MAGDYLVPLAVSKRVRFYDGQFLQDQDFIDEQKYHVARLGRHQRSLHVAGVVEGLTAYTPAKSTFQIRVRVGSAIDPEGRQILLPAPSLPIDLPANSANGERWLYIAYHQVPSDLQSSGEGVEGETRWTEAPYIFSADKVLGVDDDYSGPDWNGYLPTDAGPPSPVLLAKLTVDGGGKVKVDNNVRSFSGVRLPGPATSAPALRTTSSGNVGLWLSHDNDLYQRLTITPTGNVGLDSLAPTAALEIKTTLKATTQRKSLIGLHIAPTFDEAKVPGVKKHGLIVEGGNVGIGTTAPNASLEAFGTVRGSNNANHYTEIGHGGSHGFINTVGNGNLDFRHDDTTYMSLRDNGNVGINQFNPSAKLEVNGSFKANSNVSGERAMLMEAPSAGNHRGDGNTQNATGLVYRIETNPAAGEPILQVRSSGGAVRLFAEHDGWTGSTSNSAWFGGSRDNYLAGKVGIGTPSPGEKLAVSGGKVQLDGNQQLVFTNTDTTNNLKLQLWQGYGLGINGATLFYAANGNHSWRDTNGTNERMRLTTAANGGLTVLGTGDSSFGGNVGIGTTEPLHRLDVNGRMQLTNGVIQRSGAAITNTSDLGLYSRIKSSWIRIVTNDAPIKFFTDDGSGSNPTVTISNNGNLYIGSTGISENELKILKKLINSQLKVLIQSEKGHVLDNYGQRQGDGDNDRSIQFRSNNTHDKYTKMRLIISS